MPAVCACSYHKLVNLFLQASGKETTLPPAHSGLHYVMAFQCFARIERGQGADLGKGHFCARSMILRALLCTVLHFEDTMGKITYLLT